MITLISSFMSLMHNNSNQPFINTLTTFRKKSTVYNIDTKHLIKIL